MLKYILGLLLTCSLHPPKKFAPPTPSDVKYMSWVFFWGGGGLLIKLALNFDKFNFKNSIFYFLPWIYKNCEIVKKSRKFSSASSATKLARWRSICSRWSATVRTGTGPERICWKNRKFSKKNLKEKLKIWKFKKF